MSQLRSTFYVRHTARPSNPYEKPGLTTACRHDAIPGGDKHRGGDIDRADPGVPPAYPHGPALVDGLPAIRAAPGCGSVYMADCAASNMLPSRSAHALPGTASP